ncbi:hypothetical protein DU16_0177 [Chlamydia trachomatis]|nr:hypothetical protein [Chlamydia trachomatis]AKR41233.1 hypothetical protein IaCS19096_00895 [Chlamydia trachomatis]ROT51341.1 hypothetical protein DU16_0177 [Chlamydia trachomatis]
MLRLFCLGYFPQLFEKQKNLLEDLIYNKLFVEKTVVMGEGACVVNLAIGGGGRPFYFKTSTEFG